MSIYSLLFLAEDDTFSDLKDIANKIIPNDPWAFVIQLSATLILVLILAKFLVKPVRKFLQDRHDYIQNNLDEASLKNNEADNKLQIANEQLKNAKKESKEMVENAKVAALNEKDKILNETQQEVKMLKDKAQQDLENERIKMQEKISSEIVDVALLAANKVIEREVTSEDNKKIIESFIEDQK